MEIFFNLNKSQHSPPKRFNYKVLMVSVHFVSSLKCIQLNSVRQNLYDETFLMEFLLSREGTIFASWACIFSPVWFWLVNPFLTLTRCACFQEALLQCAKSVLLKYHLTNLLYYPFTAYWLIQYFYCCHLDYFL